MLFNELELKRIDRTVGELCRRSTRPEHADQLRFETGCAETSSGTSTTPPSRPRISLRL
jgi:hypothetical protein